MGKISSVSKMFVHQKLFRLLFLVFFICWISCETASDAKKRSVNEGKSLAAAYCQSCHMYPEPSLLDKKTWKEGVLPVMGNYFGIQSELQVASWEQRRVPASKSSTSPSLSKEDWQKIVDFYTESAPDSLVRTSQPINLTDTIPGFSIVTPQRSFSSPGLTFVAIDTMQKNHRLLATDISSKFIYDFNQNLQLQDSLSFFGGMLVNMEIHPDNLFLCNVGILSPNNGLFGKGQQLLLGKQGKIQNDTLTLFSNLARPVEILSGDLDMDGKKDYLVCEFGHDTGALSWRRNLGNNKFETKILRAFPGAIKSFIQDYNGDNLPDIWTLFTQGDEGIFLFTNKGSGVFEEKLVLRFPPSYGSSSFELVDVNKDGIQDIVYTCGDNSDFSAVLKPYHGVYIYLNDGNNVFRQKYFFPINGCYKSITSDFDYDGDMDIVTISFFADYLNRPEEGFIYLRNEGNFSFNPFSFNSSVSGRWLTMDAGDLDGDGKKDVVLGNLSIGPYNIKSAVDWSNGPLFIFLKNKTR